MQPTPSAGQVTADAKARKHTRVPGRAELYLMTTGTQSLVSLVFCTCVLILHWQLLFSKVVDVAASIVVVGYEST